MTDKNYFCTGHEDNGEVLLCDGNCGYDKSLLTAPEHLIGTTADGGRVWAMKVRSAEETHD